jgi:hypothetical protein
MLTAQFIFLFLDLLNRSSISDTVLLHEEINSFWQFEWPFKSLVKGLNI